jgi:Protein of unknown function (DUF1091)
MNNTTFILIVFVTCTSNRVNGLVSKDEQNNIIKFQHFYFKFFRRNAFINLTKAEVFSDAEFMLSNTTAYYLPKQTKFSLYLNVLVDLEDIFVEIRIRHYSNGAYVPSFLNLNVNFCDFLKMKKSVPVLEKIYNHFRQYGIFPEKCPIKKVRCSKYVTDYDY